MPALPFQPQVTKLLTKKHITKMHAEEKAHFLSSQTPHQVETEGPEVILHCSQIRSLRSLEPTGSDILMWIWLQSQPDLDLNSGSVTE